MKIKAGLLGFLVVGLGFAGSAMAQVPPPGCDEPRERRAFEAGVASGRSLVEQAWNSVAECGSLESFSTAVMSTLESVSLPPGSDDYVTCRTVGTLTGAAYQVDDVWVACAIACCDEGELVGWIMGKLYCDLAIAFDGVRLVNFLQQQPISFCGATAQGCCRSEFTSVTRGYHSIFGQCRPYTQGEHRRQWTRSRDSVCAYRP